MKLRIYRFLHSLISSQFMKSRASTLLVGLFLGGHLVAQEPALHYVIVLDQTPAGRPYKQAADALAKLRTPAALVPLSQDGLRKVFEQLRKLHPDFVAFVVPPGRIEDNFVGEVFERASRLDEDPELDFAYGFVTGATPEDALALVRNTARAESDRASIPKKFVAIEHTFRESDLGIFAFEQARLHENYGYHSEPINPVDDSVDWQTRVPGEMRKLDGASLVYCAGHGMGDRLCGIDADAFTGFQLDRAVVVLGPCHSAVTVLRHDIEPGSLGVKTVTIPVERSICLKLIKAGAVAQLGSTASSSWGNVGPATSGFFNEAKTMGQALQDRINAHIRPFEDVPDPTQWHTILTKRASDDPQSDVTLKIEYRSLGREIRFWFRLRDESGHFSGAGGERTLVSSPNRWNHPVLTFSRYEDGPFHGYDVAIILDGSGGVFVGSTADLHADLGAGPFQLGGGFYGLVDEFRVSNAELESVALLVDFPYQASVATIAPKVEITFPTCTWRIAIQAAIGSSNNPWQWLCQR